MHCGGWRSEGGDRDHNLHHLHDCHLHKLREGEHCTGGHWLRHFMLPYLYKHIISLVGANTSLYPPNRWHLLRSGQIISTPDKWYLLWPKISTMTENIYSGHMITTLTINIYSGQIISTLTKNICSLQIIPTPDKWYILWQKISALCRQYILQTNNVYFVRKYLLWTDNIYFGQIISTLDW